MSDIFISTYLTILGEYSPKLYAGSTQQVNYRHYLRIAKQFAGCSLTFVTPSGKTTSFDISGVAHPVPWMLAAAQVVARNRPLQGALEQEDWEEGWEGFYHPVILHAACLFGDAKDFHKLALENPAPSRDGSKIAYIRDENYRKKGVRTAVAAGKYIKRHWPHAKDSEIASLVRLHFPAPSEFKILTDMKDIIHAIQTGPASCMQWNGKTISGKLYDPDGYENVHPYEAYAPEFGWGLAVLLENGEVTSRALVQVKDKVFVRTFTQGDTQYGRTCHELEVRLEAEGYFQDSSWEGFKLAKVGWRCGEFIAPYIDGDCQSVSVYDDYLLITNDEPEFSCTSTKGFAERVTYYSCDCCGDSVDCEDDLVYVESTEQNVCSHCERYNFQSAYTGRFTELVSNDETVYEYGDDYYTQDGLEYHNLVILHSGDVAPFDDAVYYRDDYFHTEDCVLIDDEYVPLCFCEKGEDGVYKLLGALS